MADQILGLTTGASFGTTTYHNRNHRRRVFHDHPTGAAPLTGLLSLMETEDVDSPDDFGWWEKRFDQPETTINDASDVPFNRWDNGTTDGADPINFTSTYSAAASTGNPYNNIAIQLASSTGFQVGQVIMIIDAALDSGATQNLRFVVTGVDTYVANQILCRSLETVTGVSNSADDQNDKSVVVIGSAHSEGATALTGTVRLPVKHTNHTQIFRNAFSFTRTALKHPTDFDSSGIYKEKAKDNAIDHMVEMELAFLYGVKGQQNIVVDGETLPERTTGGVRYFLEQWEAANSTYRGGSGAAAVTLNSDANKRIINFSTGSVAWKDFNDYIERAFRVTNNRAFEKLVLCGNGFLAAINTALENRAVTNKNFRSETVYGINITTWESPFGTLHFKTHPLLNRSAAWRNDAIILDVQNLKFRPLNDSDTTLLKNRQSNGQDRRKDEWLTEAGLECRFPESHMWFENLQTITI
mgnify:FL=1